MGLLDKMGSTLQSVLANTNFGNLQGLAEQLQQGGLGAQVKSWLGNGANLPVSPEQIQSALNSDQLKQLAQQFGVSPDAVTQLLAKYLPTAVDQASPGGSLKDPQP
jgi:uncharacterized protein YidB (DUF937 family)